VVVVSSDAPPIFAVSSDVPSDLDGIFRCNQLAMVSTRETLDVPAGSYDCSFLLRINPSQEGITSLLRPQIGREWEIEEK
jgi:hypothetical protein